MNEYDNEQVIAFTVYTTSHQIRTTMAFTYHFRLITLGDGSARDIVGRAIVIHEGPDSWGQPTGDAGARLGCGIIKRIRNKKQTKKFKVRIIQLVFTGLHS